MELFDYFMQFLLENCPVKDEEFLGVRMSLIEAVKDYQYLTLKTDNGKFIGFITWEIRKSLNEENKIDIGITNLVIEKRCRGTYPLIKIINHLRIQYSNIDQFIWMNRRTKKMFEAKQKDKTCLSTL